MFPEKQQKFRIEFRLKKLKRTLKPTSKIRQKLSKPILLIFLISPILYNSPNFTISPILSDIGQ